jgi:molybdopterin/thiamine biosynthesis adenylyltransferase
MDYTLTTLENYQVALEEAVFSREGLEGAAYLLCGLSITEVETRLLVREVIPVKNEHYLKRERNKLSIDSVSYSTIAKRASAIGAAVLFVHSHPAGPPTFSPQDNGEEPKLMEFFSARYPDVVHGSLVVAPGSLWSGRLWVKGRWVTLRRIRVIGRRFRFLDFHLDEMPMPDFFDRQVRAFGPDIQRILQRLHVGVVGVGGTGSPVVEQLVRLGVGRISEFDGDIFEDSNSTRVYGSRFGDQGINKAELSAEHVNQIGMGTVVRAYSQHINCERVAKLLRECDVVFGCTDKQTPRGILVQLALRYYIPVFDLGVKIDAENKVLRSIVGRVTTIIPGEACLFCRERISAEMIRLESLSPEEQQLLADENYAPQLETENPAVITFTTAVAAQAVSELLHRLTGFMGEQRRSSEVLMLFHQTEVRTNRTPSDPNCLCAQQEFWGTGDRKDFLGLFWPKTSEDQLVTSRS